MNRRTAESGFTLLELLMVVIIIAILAALALPAYFKAAEKSRAAEATLTMGALKGAIQRFCIENVAGAPTLANLDVENPATIANAQFTYVITAPVSCPIAAAGINIVATRVGGPCPGSTITMQFPPGIVGQNPFTYVWLPNPGPCV